MIKKVIIMTVMGVSSSTALGCDIWQAVENDDAKRIEEIIFHRKNANDFFESSGSTPLHLAASWNKVKALAALIRLGANVNAATHCVCGLDDQDDTPLYEAAGGGHVDCIRLLCEAGAAVNAKNASGVMPLQIAALRGHTNAVRLLLEYGADPSHKVWTWGYITAEDAAVHGDKKECLEVLRSWVRKKASQ